MLWKHEYQKEAEPGAKDVNSVDSHVSRKFQKQRVVSLWKWFWIPHWDPFFFHCLAHLELCSAEIPFHSINEQIYKSSLIDW